MWEFFETSTLKGNGSLVAQQLLRPAGTEENHTGSGGTRHHPSLSGAEEQLASEKEDLHQGQGTLEPL